MSYPGNNALLVHNKLGVKTRLGEDTFWEDAPAATPSNVQYVTHEESCPPFALLEEWCHLNNIPQMQKVAMIQQNNVAIFLSSSKASKFANLITSSDRHKFVKKSKLMVKSINQYLTAILLHKCIKMHICCPLL